MCSVVSNCMPLISWASAFIPGMVPSSMMSPVCFGWLRWVTASHPLPSNEEHLVVQVGVQANACDLRPRGGYVGSQIVTLDRLVKYVCQFGGGAKAVFSESSAAFRSF